MRLSILRNGSRRGDRTPVPFAPDEAHGHHEADAVGCDVGLFSDTAHLEADEVIRRQDTPEFCSTIATVRLRSVSSD